MYKYLTDQVSDEGPDGDAAHGSYHLDPVVTIDIGVVVDGRVGVPATSPDLVDDLGRPP